VESTTSAGLSKSGLFLRKFTYVKSLITFASARSAERIDIADQIVDLSARQREIGHRTMGTREKRAKLIGGHAAVCHLAKAGWPLRNGAAGVAVDNVAIRAPLPRQLATSGGISVGRIDGSQRKYGEDQQ
jgi:hypothetical protein